MSPTIQVCCNGASAEGHSDPLRLEYSPSSTKRNVRLGLPRFVTELLHIPPRTLDLLELASYIYAADRNTHRGSRDAVEFHAWSRRLCFRMRVRDVEFWNRVDVQEALRQCLVFMTGHADFSFVFSGGHRTPPTNLFDQEGVVLPRTDGPHRVALFSGGLDSLSGAVQMLTGTGASLVLVSHHSQPTSKQVQRRLANALNKRFPGRASLYGFECTLTGVHAAEETQRSRSFLYCAIGFALARAYQTNSLTIYENGVTSMNLGRREDLLNARASRTTHPRTLETMQAVLSLVANTPFKIEQPAFWLTKRDVVDNLVTAGHGDLIASSVSCSRTFQREGAATHCGRCFQCVDRRLAVFAAGRESLDDPSLYTIDIARQSLPDEESRTTTVDYLRQAAKFADITDDAFSNEHMSELADAYDALPTTGGDMERAHKVWQLMRQHGENVRSGLTRVRQLYDDPLAPLPGGSLLGLVASREHLRPAVLRLAYTISEIAAAAVGTMFRHAKPKSENDLNAKLASLINSHYELTSEHPLVSFAGARVTADHAIVDVSLLFESKYIRTNTPPSKATEGMAADLTKYPPNSHILFLVYDPHHKIADDTVFKRDFESRGRCTVTILR